MNKKNSVKKTAALLLGVALAIGSTGCGNFIVIDNEKDLAQTVAEVNISKQLKNDATYASVATEVEGIVKSLSADIKKRDLVAYFLSTGYQYVESYGYSYEDTFNMLMDGLVSREIMIQYAIAYYLKNNTALNGAGCKSFVEQELAAAKARSAKEEELLKAHPEVLTLKYFLTENGTTQDDYKLAVYNLKKSLNNSLDSLEKNYIKAETEEETATETRTLPTGVNTEKEDYYNENYGVYTGRNTKDGEGGYHDYEKVDGSTTSTRQKAYNAFLANLEGYSMISTSGSIEDTSKVELLDYYYVELSSLLGQALITKYFEALEDSVTDNLDEAYMTKKYDEIYEAQETTYKNNPTAFATAMDSVSDTSFLLYGLNGYGYVYNILLPFSTSQNVAYTTAKNNKANTQDDLYNIRKGILANVKGKDLRESWIEADHFYKDGESYLFFEDNLSENTKYEQLKQYAGTYAYNGTAVETDGEWEFTPNEITIDEFITTMEGHINATVGSSVASGTKDSAYDADNKATVYTDANDKVDYSKFVYYKGQANLGAVAAKDYFNKESNVYKAVSAVNELMFAYSTDTGCLNTYFGYAVSPYKTNFVKEFEYAAQEAIKSGVGSYVVCATDYGWHIVFASYVYDTENVYGGYSATEAETEGTFSNLFYESLKTSAASNYTTEVQNSVLNTYNNDDSVTLYKSRYKDLLELQANN